MSETATSIKKPVIEVELGEAIDQLLAESKQMEHVERRAELRHPFLGLVSVTSMETGKGLISAFSREISRSGIGLLHYKELRPGPVLLTLTSPAGTKLEVVTDILWCRPMGEGWFVSGGRSLSQRNQLPRVRRTKAVSPAVRFDVQRHRAFDVGEEALWLAV